MHYVVLRKAGDTLVLLDGRAPHVLYKNCNIALNEFLGSGALRLPENAEMMRLRVLQ